MDPRHLKSFVAIIEEGSFRDAARRLGIRQPSLSQQIGRLEDQLGEMLFDRHADGVTLTPTGEMLRERAYDILGMIEETHRLIREDPVRGRGTVKVAAIPTVAPYALPRAIRMLRDRFEYARVTIVEAPTPEVLHLVAKNEVDFGIVATDVAADERCVSEHITDEPLVVVMAEGSACSQRPFLCTEDLRDAGVIVLGDMHCLGDQVVEFCAANGVDRVTRIESGQVATLVELVRHDVGVTLLPAPVFESHNTDGITIRPVKDAAPMRPIRTVWRKGRPRSQCAAVLAGCLASASAERGHAGVRHAAP